MAAQLRVRVLEDVNGFGTAPLTGQDPVVSLGSRSSRALLTAGDGQQRSVMKGCFGAFLRRSHP